VTAPLRALNTFHEKFLLYQQVAKTKSEQTVKHAIIALLDNDYGHEQETRLARMVQEERKLTVIALINEITTLQNLHHRLNGKRNLTKSTHGKRKKNDDQDGFKRQYSSGRNGHNGKSAAFQYDNPICRVCGKRHAGKCTNQQALQRYRNKNSYSNGNTSSQLICGYPGCGKIGHTTENCHMDPKNREAAAEWKAKKQQEHIRHGNGKPKFNGYKPKVNINKVNNSKLDANDGNDDDVTMTDVVQNTTHIEPEDDLLDFDSD